MDRATLCSTIRSDIEKSITLSRSSQRQNSNLSAPDPP
ncbi:hypothetical protein RB2654_14090 [Rhodobacterales bacterium HTCC2654]|uniref:Uncharacterized protein n=1 Tax=Maritimibacter alkaliphilus HTCC2654 TaxID=314271 RepID=A3VGL7_9RHOB|nr:hypothetical protein RB2654_14090 [Rhodobacterales bacterium HTCC2654] [Maritimibacter alkaliphilus HTCC2654]